MSNMNKITNVWKGQMDSALQKETSLTKAQRDALIDTTIEVSCATSKGAADAMASDATTFEYAFVVPWDCQIVSIKLIPKAALTANGTNYATLTFNKNDGAGGSATAVATALTTASTSWVAGTVVSLTVTESAKSLTSGQMLYAAITKAAAGVVVPASTVVYTLRKV